MVVAGLEECYPFVVDRVQSGGQLVNDDFRVINHECCCFDPFSVP